MEKTIKIGKKEVKLSNNAAWTMEYRDQFGRDIVPAIMPVVISMVESVSSVIAETGTTINNIDEVARAIEGKAMDIMLPMFQVEFVDVIINVLWSMAKVVDEDIDPPKQWIKQFDEFPLDVILPAVYELILKGFISSKNFKRLKMMGSNLKNLKNLQPSHSTTLSSQDSNED